MAAIYVDWIQERSGKTRGESCDFSEYCLFPEEKTVVEVVAAASWQVATSAHSTRVSKEEARDLVPGELERRMKERK